MSAIAASLHRLESRRTLAAEILPLDGWVRWSFNVAKFVVDPGRENWLQRVFTSS